MDERFKRPPGRPRKIIDEVKDAPSAQHESVIDSLSDAQPLRPRQRRTKRFQDAELLPAPPKLSGYHSTWIGGEPLNEGSIRNNFLRNGYTPISYSEAAKGDPENWPLSVIPVGMDENSNVTINEKKAYKVPLEDYLEYMADVGHDQPLEYENDAATKFKREAPTHRGNSLISEDGDGFSFGHQTGQKSKQPNFRGAVNTGVIRR
jgi:hypothetical protein